MQCVSARPSPCLLLEQEGHLRKTPKGERIISHPSGDAYSTSSSSPRMPSQTLSNSTHAPTIAERATSVSSILEIPQEPIELLLRSGVVVVVVVVGCANDVSHFFSF